MSLIWPICKKSYTWIKNLLLKCQQVLLAAKSTSVEVGGRFAKFWWYARWYGRPRPNLAEVQKKVESIASQKPLCRYFIKVKYRNNISHGACNMYHIK